MDLAQLERAHAVGAPQVQQLGFGRVFAGNDLLFLDADHGAGDGSLLRDGLDFFAASLVQDAGQGRIAGQVDGERFKRPLDRGIGFVGNGGDMPAIEVAQHHRLEQVVDVGDGKAQVDAGVVLDDALALEIADAAAEEHHLGNRQLRRPHGGRAAAAGLGVRLHSG